MSARSTVGPRETAARSSAGEPDGPVVEALQRAAILRATIDLVAERGYADVSLGQVIAQAGVSRQAFHRHFDGIEACFMAILDAGTERIATVLTRSFDRERERREALLAGLAAVLGTLDGDPKLARVLLVDALAAGMRVLEHRERNVERLRRLLVERLEDAVTGQPSLPLGSEGVMMSLLGIVHNHLVRGDGAPLMTLLGPLMGIVTASCRGPTAAALEARRGERLSRRILAEAGTAPPAALANADRVLPPALLDSRAHRVRACLLFVDATPGASNQRIAEGCDIASHAQTSTLLRRLASMDLLVKRAGGPGRPNAWLTTPAGATAAGLLRRADGLPGCDALRSYAA